MCRYIYTSGVLTPYSGPLDAPSLHAVLITGTQRPLEPSNCINKAIGLPTQLGTHRGKLVVDRSPSRSPRTRLRGFQLDGLLGNRISCHLDGLDGLFGKLGCFNSLDLALDSIGSIIFAAIGILLHQRRGLGRFGSGLGALS